MPAECVAPKKTGIFWRGLAVKSIPVMNLSSSNRNRKKRMFGVLGLGFLLGMGALSVVIAVLLFGLGSMLGMGALSAVVAVPLAVSARWLTWANRRLQGSGGGDYGWGGVGTIWAAGVGAG
jgi:hypothetical protein